MKDLTMLLYSAVMWNRVEPKDIPTIQDVMEMYGDLDEDTLSKKVQPVSEQTDILKTFAARSKAMGKAKGGMKRGGKKN